MSWGKHWFNYSIELHQPEEKFSNYLHAIAAQIPFSTQANRIKKEHWH